MLKQKNFGGEKDFFVVAVGILRDDSAALAEFFSKVPQDSGLAYVVLGHDDKPVALKKITSLPLKIVTRNVQPKPNHVYLVPKDKDVMVADGKLQATEPQGRGETLDRFFRSLAEGFEGRLIAVLLSEGSNGTLGLRHVKEHWGVTLASSSESAVAANVVDIVLPISEIPSRLLAVAQTSGQLGAIRERIATLEVPTGSDPTGLDTIGLEAAQPIEIPPAEVASDALNNILALIKEKTGHDFHNYKQPTLLRRIARRLQVHELSDMAGYLGFLNKKPEEIKGLIGDLLISVTNFFRDEESFEALRAEIIPKLFANKTSTDTVRVWSCGCATGEEAYSLAMLFSEYTSTLTDAPKFQIFASDISEEAIRTARDGHYDEKSIQDVSEERLKRFFIEDGDLYSVKKELRDTVLFTVHNVLRDPPFSRLELISCRNLLIYLNRETQEKVLRLFQFALRPGGFLFLGSSESTESASGLFTTLDKPNRLYQSKATTTAYGALSVLPSAGRWEVKIPDLPTRQAQQRVSYGELHYKFLEGFSPPSLLVNEDDTIVHVSESAGQFLHTSGGEPTRQLFQAVKPALKLAVQRALFEAKKGTGIGTSRNVPLKLEGEDTTVTITVRLVKMSGTGSGFYIVTFALGEAKDEVEATTALVATDSQQDGLVTWLEEELQANREGLRLTIEQYETSAEELRASNEELQAVNEELRAASEELETSKEELQSLNEELMTMVDDQKRTELALRDSETKYRSLFESIEEGFCLLEVIFDEDHRAADYLFLETNTVFEEQTGLRNPKGKTARELGSPLEQGWTKTYGNVALTGEGVRFEYQSALTSKWFDVYASRVGDSPSRRVALVFNDITERKGAEDSLRRSEERLQLGVNVANFALAEVDYATNTIHLTKEAAQLYGLGNEEMTVTRERVHATFHEDEQSELEAIIQEVLDPEGKGWFAREHRVVWPNGEVRWLNVHKQVFFDRTARPTRPRYAMLAAQDISERKESEEALRQQQRFTEGILGAAPSLTYIYDLQEGRNTFISAQTAHVIGYTPEEIQALGSEVMPSLLHPDDAKAVAERFETIVSSSSGAIYDLEYRMQHKNGSWVWLLSRDQVFARDERGQPTQLLGVATEITERKRTEEIMHQTNKRFERAERAARGFVFEWTLATGRVERSSGVTELLGYTPEDLAASFEAWDDFVHPDDRPRLTQERETQLGAGRGYSLEYRVRHKEGHYLYVWDRGEVEHGESGETVRVVGSTVDVTERKRAEDKVRRSEAELRLVTDAIPALVSYVDTEYRYRLANKAYIEWFGLEPATIVGRTMMEILGEAAFERLRPHLDLVLSGKTAIFEAEIPYRHGGTRFVHAIYTPDVKDNKVTGFFVHTLDISERKRRENNLAFLADLSEEFSHSTEQGIMQGVGAKIGAYLGVSHCLFADINEARSEVRVESAWHTSDAPGLVGVYQLPNFVSDEFQNMARAKKTIVITDTQNDPLTNAAAYAAFNIGAFISVPFHQGDTWTYLFTINNSKARVWRDDEIELIQEVTNRVFPRLERLRAETALREQLSLTATITSNATQAIFMMDEQGYCTFMNPAAEHLLGFTFGEIRTKPLHDMIHHHHPDGRLYPMSDCPIDRALPENFDIREHEDVFIRKNGEFFPVLVAASPIFKDGKPVSTVIEVRDISERKRTEEQGRRLQTLTARLATALTSDDVVKAVLEEGFAALGSSAGSVVKVIGEELEIIGTIGYPESLTKPWQRFPLASATPLGEAARTGVGIWIGSPGDFQKRYGRLPDAALKLSQAWVALPLLAGNKTLGALGLSYETPQTFDADSKRFAETLASLCAQALERSRLFEEVLTSEHELREADKRKDEFLAVLAHELRNPLAPIRTGIEIMKRTKDEATQQEARDIIERQSAQMVRLIDDLLDVSRISRGTIKLEKERLELASIVRLAVESAHVPIEDRDHTLSVTLPEEPVWLEGDKTRLCQIVLNLLTNSAKYTNAGGNISLVATVDATLAPAHVVISVKDNGIGIPADMLTNVFEMFTRVERETSYQQEGLGIGLNLVKQLVELHGGTVEAFSDGENQGSTFVVQLPVLNDEPVQDEHLNEEARPDSKFAPVAISRRVLVVDDYEPNRKTLARMLRLMGHEVTTAVNGEEALATLKTFVPEVILLDINMPGINGYEVARQIRSNAAYNGVKLVALTGYGQDTDLQHTKESGFDHHLVKPVEVDKLEAILARGLNPFAKPE